LDHLESDMQMTVNATPNDPDLALWERARGMLAEEIGYVAGEPGFKDEGDRAYIEQHAPAYAAALVAEEEEDEALYDEAHRRLAMAAANTMSTVADDTVRLLLALAAPVVVHAALESRS
jgi:hypothetical protein